MLRPRWLRGCTALARSNGGAKIPSAMPRRGIQDCAVSDAAVPGATAAEADIADTLKVAALAQLFRSRGHLVAQLDPLQRVSYGPWLGDIGIASPWYAQGLRTPLKLQTRILR